MGTLALGSGLAVFGLLLAPLRVELSVEDHLPRGAHGLSLSARRVTAGWRPWDALLLDDVEITVPVPWGAPLRVEGSRLRVSRDSFGLSLSELPRTFERAELTGLRAILGPLAFVDGELDVAREGEQFRVRGWAASSEGGVVDVRGRLSTTPPHVGRLRFYLDGVRAPTARSLGAIELAGTIDVERLGQESDRTRMALRLRAPGESDHTPALVARTEGTIERHAGIWNAQKGLRINGELRRGGTDPLVWGIHGPFDAALRLRGGPGAQDARLEIRLARASLTAGRWLEKPAGVPAYLALVARFDSESPVRAEAEARVGGIRAAGYLKGGGPWAWNLRSAWCPIDELLARVPALSEGIPLDDGRVRASVVGEELRPIEASLEIADLGLANGAVLVSSASVLLAGGGLRLPQTTIRLAGQPVEVVAEAQPGTGGSLWRLDLRARAPRIRLDALAGLLPQELPPEEGPPTDLEGKVSAAVRWLHTRAYHLRGIEVRPLRIDVESLSAEGLPARPVRIDGAFEGRVLRLHLERGMETGRPQSFCLDLKRWRPSLSSARLDTRRCRPELPGFPGG